MNNTISVRQCGDGKIFTRDAAYTKDAAQRSRDMLLTTSNRLTAEPAPPAPDLGVRHDGSPGGGTTPNVEVIFDSFVKALEPLGPADKAKIKALMQKYAGANTSTNSVGITTSDANDAVRRGIDQINSVQNANKAFWDRKIEADNKAMFGSR